MKNALLSIMAGLTVLVLFKVNIVQSNTSPAKLIDYQNTEFQALTRRAYYDARKHASERPCDVSRAQASRDSITYFKILYGQ